MTREVIHRGPDAHGVWISESGRTGLGHQRLSIIDLTESGRQPIRSPSGRIVLSYNGEVYNYRDLKHELQGLGHSFSGTSDSEVVAASVDEYGIESAVNRLHGMFAFAAVDLVADRLYLVRDRAGQKPLYFGRAGEDLVFASELDALLRHPNLEFELDDSSVRAFLANGYVPEPNSILRCVNKVPPGTYCTLPIDKGWVRPKIQRYWSAADVERGGREERVRPGWASARYSEEFERIFGQAVIDRLVADVPVGLLLSGGVDSSIVAAMARKLAGRQLRSFTVSMKGTGYDEAGDARKVARALDLRHREVTVGPSEAAEVARELGSLCDEPLAHASFIPTYLVAGVARDEVKVVLSGDGGDELFGGYNRHLLARYLSWLFRSDMYRLRQWMASATALGRNLSAGAGGAKLASILKISDWGLKMDRFSAALNASSMEQAYQTLTSSPRLLSPAGRGERRSADVGVSSLADGRRGLNGAEQFMLADWETYLPGGVLPKVDRASMAQSLEVRSPFLDPRVVAFSWRVPIGAKIRGFKGKRLLRGVLREYLSRDCTERPKSGFTVPIGKWLRGRLQTWAESHLDWDEMQAFGHVDVNRCRDEWARLQSGKESLKYELWAVVVLQAWIHEHQ